MVDRSGDRDHEVLRAVVATVVIPDGIAGDRIDGVGAAADRTTERMLAEHGLEEALARDVGRVVVGHRQLFEDHPALVLELRRVEQRSR